MTKRNPRSSLHGAAPLVFLGALAVGPALAQEAPAAAPPSAAAQSQAPSQAPANAPAQKPAFSPDPAQPFSTQSHISATIEFSLPALADQVAKDIPRRLATFDQRVSCVHRRVFGIKINASCNVSGFVERTGPISISGRNGAIFGSMPIYGVVRGEGANRFTAGVRGGADASATVEAEARPQLTRDWSLDLNLSDSFHWSRPPVLHVLGLDIPVARYAEPQIRKQLARVKERAIAAAKRLNIRDKAARAWKQASDPIELSQAPEVWLQLTPQSAALGGVVANGRVLSGALEISGQAQTFVGQSPPAVAATPLPALGRDVSNPEGFDAVLPVRIGYDLLKTEITQTLAGIAPPSAQMIIRDVQVYPSSGKLVIGLRVAKASDADPNDGQWVYLTGALQPAADGQALHISDVALSADYGQLTPFIEGVRNAIHEKVDVDYRLPLQSLLKAGNDKLSRPLKDGFRMDGQLTSAKLEKIVLSADALIVVTRASGHLKIVYGM